MKQIIEMSRHYRKRPSELMAIDDDYAAYCFDEVCYLYETQIIDDKGRMKWNKINWDDKKKESNKDLMNLIKKHS